MKLTSKQYKAFWESMPDSYENMDNLFDDLETSRSLYPWYKVVKIYFNRAKNKVKDVMRQPKIAKQRATRGFSYRDLWSFDAYLARVISQGCRELAIVEHGHPCGITYEEWIAILNKIADGFEAYEEILDFKADDIELRKAQYDEAMKLFVQYFEHLWD